MTNKGKTRRSDCPINFSLELFGDRWSLLVIRDLVFAGKRHFREMLESPERISTNILSDRLKRLEENGIVTRRTDPESGREVLYTLTDKGRDLIPVLLEIIRWAGKYDPDTAAPDRFLQRLDTERDDLIAELRDGVFSKD